MLEGEQGDNNTPTVAVSDYGVKQGVPAPREDSAATSILRSALRAALHILNHRNRLTDGGVMLERGQGDNNVAVSDYGVKQGVPAP